MVPIVHGLKRRYSACLTVDEVNFHAASPLRDELNPLGSPEFFLIDTSGKSIYRWFGFTEAEEFDSILEPLCAAD